MKKKKRDRRVNVQMRGASGGVGKKSYIASASGVTSQTRRQHMNNIASRHTAALFRVARLFDAAVSTEYPLIGFELERVVPVYTNATQGSWFSMRSVENRSTWLDRFYERRGSRISESQNSCARISEHRRMWSRCIGHIRRSGRQCIWNGVLSEWKRSIDRISDKRASPIPFANAQRKGITFSDRVALRRRATEGGNR